MNIKCVTYSRFSTSNLIHTYVLEKGVPSMSTDAQNIPSKIKTLKSKIDQRQKLKTGYGVWWATRDENDICYAVCTQENYPERHAFGLIQKIKQKIKEVGDAQFQQQTVIKKATQSFVEKTAIEYNDLTKIDKLAKANSQVKQLQGQLGVGIKKLMNNQQSLSQMDSKADRMKSYANQFHKNSQKLQRMLYWRNMKLKILIGLCILGLIGFVILIIVQTTRNQNQ